MPQPQEKKKVTLLASVVPASSAFNELFGDTMTLVEQTAAYLDGKGRKASKELSRPVQIAYANESVRLTTRLMAMASWALLMRAVKEGERTLPQFCKEIQKTRFESAWVRFRSSDERSYGKLPEELRVLIECSYVLAVRMRRLDRIVRQEVPSESRNPVARMQEDLQARLKL